MLQEHSHTFAPYDPIRQKPCSDRVKQLKREKEGYYERRLRFDLWRVFWVSLALAIGLVISGIFSVIVMLSDIGAGYVILVLAVWVFGFRPVIRYALAKLFENKD